MGFTEIIILSVLALIFIGPKQLPELARTIGRLMNELKRTSGEFTSTLTQTQQQATDFIQQTESDLHQAVVGGLEEEDDPDEGGFHGDPDEEDVAFVESFKKEQKAKEIESSSEGLEEKTEGDSGPIEQEAAEPAPSDLKKGSDS